jgi:DNA gyrase/topoisomerase IV subunit B/DNA gyrase/topoisomerase IV subunit A
MPLIEDLMNPDIDLNNKTTIPVIKKKSSTEITKKIVKNRTKNNDNDNDNDNDKNTKNEDDESVQPDDLNLKYQKKSPKEHIKDLPDTYIGSIIKETTNIYTIQERSITIANSITTDNVLDESISNTYDNSKGVCDSTGDCNSTGEVECDVDCNSTVEGEIYNKYRIVTKEIEYVPGLRSIIEEILVNAFDNMNRINQKIITEKKKLKKVSYIKVWTNRESGQITIENDGEGIDVAKHPDKEVYDGYIPQMIFGELLTSGNYNKSEKKITGGKNGYGAKLTNIFSKYFKIETVDCIRKLKYIQEYHNNMDIICEPVIEEYKDVPYTRISFIPDYPKFSFDGMTNDLEHMIMKRTIDMFACSHGQLEIYYNDMSIKLQNFTDYMKLYLEPEHLVVACKPNDRWEIGACMSPNFTFQQISFVNGINTQRGGKHVEYIVKQITKKMVDLIMKKKKTEVKESFIKDNLMVFVNATIENPNFDSQTKDTLTTLPRNFGSECNVPDVFIEKLAESGILDRALALSEFRDSQALKKTDGVKKKRILDIPKLDDAHWAGSKKADQCTLILTEGDSAKSMATAGISVIPNGHDLYGVYPLRGKLLNTRDKEDIILAQNKEICDIKKILALQEDMEYKDVSTLRYGRIMLMTDSDVDGSHIKGLVINFLSKWPSLMKLTGFVTSLLTPIVKVWKKGNKKGKLDAINFYTLTAYNDWLQVNNNGKGYETKYYKGLGSSTPQEGKEYFRNFKMVTYHWDEAAASSVDMAFSKERADDRKTWLANYDINSILDINQSRITISDFINKDLIHFSNYDNHRSIPSIFDGLKPSLRKIMYCSFKRNLRSEIKVAQLAGYVSEHGAYHHGEASLNGAIVNLAQNYVGTNNINLLMPEGQFGCLAPDTPILMWSGEIKNAEDIKIGDKLVGDDGNVRNVLKLTQGIDDMYELKNSQNNKLTVNSQHILTLYYTKNFELKWKQSSREWYFNYFNGSTIASCGIITNELEKTKINKTEGLNIITVELNKLKTKYNTSKIIDIKIADYIKLSNYNKKSLFMISNTKCINWAKQDVPIDPYIFGACFGDGVHLGKGFTSVDEEIIKSFVILGHTINVEITHHKNKNHDGYHYSIREKGTGTLPAIGNKENSVDKCISCLTTTNNSNHNVCVCDWHLDFEMDINYKPQKINQITEILRKNNLFKNKHIPDVYLINDKETRLQLLAGFIDTDGTIRNNNTNNVHIDISQCKRLHENLILSLEKICKSLGFATSIYNEKTNTNTSKAESKTQLTLRIYGDNIDEIPTRIARKKIIVNKTKNKYTKLMHFTKFNINYLGKNKFCGWSIDKNERFLLGNYFVTHNSRLLNGADSAAPRYIFTYLSKITHILFNKDDQPLLKACEDDGQMVEPHFYMPILPIILINGTTGIGTGWSSSIPQFNPLDIITNIRNLMNEQHIQTLTPWYRGFTGTIRKVAPNKWISKGRYKVLDTDSIEITELPIGYSTQAFKELLDNYEKGYKTNEPEDKPKRTKAGNISSAGNTTQTRKPRWVDFADSTGRLVKSYKNESSDALVKFTIKFENGVLTKLLSDTDKNGLTELDKIFQLTTSISCNNTMNLYNENNKLMNFKSAEDILNYYYEKRLHYYELRRQNLIKIKEQEVLMTSTRARFILDVINEKIKIRNIPKRDVIAQLEKLEYPIMIDGSLVEQDKLTEKQIKDDVGTFDFLISMPIYCLTKEKVEELLKEKEKHIQELETLRQKTHKILWEEDLTVFENEYKKHMDDFYDYMGIDPKKLETLTIKNIQRKVTITKRSSTAPSTINSSTQSPADSNHVSTVTSDNDD